jgi:hypothetical protein
LEDEFDDEDDLEFSNKTTIRTAELEDEEEDEEHEFEDHDVDIDAELELVGLNSEKLLYI